MMVRAVGNAVFQKQANSLLILNALRRGPLSRTELSDMLGLQRSTVTYSVARLINKDLVVELGSAAAASPDLSAGRRRRMIALNRNYGRFAGAEMLGGSFRLVICGMDGEVVEKTEVPYEPCDESSKPQTLDSDSPRQEEGRAEAARHRFAVRLKQAASRAEELCAGCRMLGIGFSVPAVVSEDGAAVKESWLHGLENADMKDTLAGFPFPARIENDARLCARAKGEAGGDMAYFLVKVSGLSEVSVGVGLMLGGKLHRGACGRSGEYISSLLAGKKHPDYQQVDRPDDMEYAARQIISDMLCLVSVLDVSKVYLNFDRSMETLFHETLRRDFNHLPDSSRGKISFDVLPWDSARGGAMMMLDGFFAVPQVGEPVDDEFFENKDVLEET